MKKIYIIGLGPGDLKDMTIRAKEILDRCKIIVGYKFYIDLVKPILGEKTYISSEMKQEIQRCEQALDIVINSNEDICIVSSGDSGIYGMAGIMIEKAAKHPEIDIEIVPGVTASIAAAAIAGAPLMNDFAVVSLSDLLVPWDTIEKRIELASMADFVIAIYNPKSKTRINQLQNAINIIMRYRAFSTPVAIVKNAYRDNETASICMLGEVIYHDVDMFTTIIVGNSTSYILNGKMVTSRGYLGNEISRL